MQDEVSKRQMSEAIHSETRRQNASLLGFFLAFSISVLKAFWPLLLLLGKGAHILSLTGGPPSPLFFSTKVCFTEETLAKCTLSTCCCKNASGIDAEQTGHSPYFL